MEKKLEQEKREMQEKFRLEVEQVEKEEEAKYERKVEQMKREMQSSSNAGGLGHELEL